MKKGFYSILAMMGMIMSANGDHTNPYARKGQMSVDDSESGKRKFYAKYLDNCAKPWKGMKYFAQYHVWAINEKNAIRKSKHKAA